MSWTETLAMPLTPDLRDYLADVARRLDAAPHGGAGTIVNEVCEFLGWSAQKLYTRLKKEVGWSSGRKTRADKGSTCVQVDKLEMLAAMKREGVRQNGKRTLATGTGASIMVANGLDLPVSNGQLNKLMRVRKLDLDAQEKADAPGQMRSLHPNHVHQVDPSLCVLYYLKGRQAIMEADQFYKNKWENYAKVKLKVWRYVLYDHASATLAVRYYEAAGENPATLFEFLMWAWGKQPGREFHGVPKILVWDKGSANTAHAIKNLLASLEVQPIEHAAGKARVKGGVENGNNLVECKFESRLKFEPVDSVEQLNEAALHWQNAFNADLIQRDDCRLRRRGMEPIARYHLWRRITAEQLRMLPDVDTCRSLLEGKEIERTVTRDLTVSFKHPAAPRTRYYKIGGLDGVNAGDKVMVRPLLIGGDCAIHLRVTRYDGEDVYFRLEAEPMPDEFGFPASAATWGVEHKATAETQADKAAKRMDALAYPEQDAAAARQKQEAPFGGQLNAHSHLADIYQPASLPRRGSEISVPMRAQVEIKPLNHVEAAALLRPKVPGWGPEHMKRLKAGWPTGVMEEDIEQVAAALRGEETGSKAHLALVR
jgi:hypothetical protein